MKDNADRMEVHSTISNYLDKLTILKEKIYINYYIYIYIQKEFLEFAYHKLLKIYSVYPIKQEVAEFT